MTIQFLSYSAIDKNRWDKTIEASRNYLPYAFSWYLDVVSPQWEALVSDDYRFVFPLTWKTKFFIKYLYQPYFTQQLGLFSAEFIDDKILHAFLKSIPSNIRFTEINLNYANSFSVPAFQSTVKTNLELDLMQPYSIIRKNYSDNIKRNITKAEKSNLQLVENCPLQDVIQLFKEGKGAELDNFKPKHYQMLETLYSVLKSKQSCNVMGVTQNGKIITGAFFVVTDKRIIFLFSGNSAMGKQSGAMHFLIDKMMSKYSDTQRIFDFEGSNNADLARFYRSFGSLENVYLHLKKNSLPYLLRLIKK
jgi:hypothetical protein